jgi:hypothetical protein
MKGTIITIIISIVAFYAGLRINFYGFLNGSSATELDVVVTIIYLSLWAYILKYSIKNKNMLVLKYNFLFWCLNLITGILVTYANLTDDSIDGAILLVILFYSQWKGINYFVDFKLSAIVYLCISLFMWLISLLYLYKIKRYSKC